MNNPLISDNLIATHEDLLREQERLTDLLKVQRGVIQSDLTALKDEFKPLIQVSSMVDKLLSRENGKDTVITAGTNMTIDLLVSTVFSRSNFLWRVILPVLLKNLSSHYLPSALPRKKDRYQHEAHKMIPNEEVMQH